MLCNVALVPEPSNPHDPDAVAVFILQGKVGPRALVGYLPANMAPLFKRSLLNTGSRGGKLPRQDRRRVEFEVEATKAALEIELDAFLPFDLIDIRNAPIQQPETSDRPKVARQPVDIPAEFFKPEQRARQKARLRK